MDLFKTTDNIWLYGLLAISVTGLCLALERSFGKPLWAVTSFRGRKTLTASTPPRSVSPEKKPGPGPTPPSSYADALPPQSREALCSLDDRPVAGHAVDVSAVKENILPMTADYRSSPDGKYTPTGISVKELKALGDFPDYATLSGVPLPRPYQEFDIEKAIPRPYRPFRWVYHQTMCQYRSYPRFGSDPDPRLTNRLQH